MQELLVAVGAARYLDHDVVLELDDLHPASHAALQIRLTLDDQGLIGAADPQVGLLHRSAEKLFEARDYRQIMMLANRHDWLSAFSSELGVALTVEAAMGIIPPPRATWTREWTWTGMVSAAPPRSAPAPPQTDSWATRTTATTGTPALPAPSASSCAVDAAGDAVRWGSISSAADLLTGLEASSVDAGDYHTCALSGTGAVNC